MKAFMFGVALGLLLTACETTPYYKAMEVVGVESGSCWSTVSTIRGRAWRRASPTLRG